MRQPLRWPFRRLISNWCAMMIGLRCLPISILILFFAGCSQSARVPAAKLTPADLSLIRGVNYRSAEAADTTDFWRRYNPAETRRDLSYADRLGVNQFRVFVNEAAWQADKSAFRRNVQDLLHACGEHHIGVMLTIGDTASFINADGSIARDQLRSFITDLVADAGREPALAFWDASNEPDYNAAGSPPDRQEKRMEIARLAASALHELDKSTPVTIGVANERTMETLADSVDVLAFHDYLPTRGAIAADIARAKTFAAHTGKQVMDTETGCIARANPYDVTLEEHMKAHVGWYIWELMITKKWGTVHGVFYPDGTVRDPAIPAAMLGLFRNRSDNAILENVDREGWVKADDAAAQAWLDNPSGDWNEGLAAGEKLANLLEGGQLTAMREPPTRTIDLLRSGPPNPAALRQLLPRYIALLKPNERQGAPATTGVRPGTIPSAIAPQVVYPIIRREGSRTPVDTSTIRGANYCYAEYGGTAGMWSNYSPAITERDLSNAQRLGINQVRVFISYPAYQANPDQFRQNLLNLLRTADAHGIGVMIVVGYGPQMQADGYPGAEEWAHFLVETLAKEPGLAFWDVYNEPDYPPNPPARVATRVAFAKHMAGVFRQLDGHTPVTIGFAYEYTMEDCAKDTDVLVYHGYQQTKQAVDLDIQKARLAGEKFHKQTMNDEMGCVARANPYDMAIHEYMNAHVGFYMWELMIVSGNARSWGDVHGIFYPDGTVRDPAIPMAMMGIFRNHGQDIVLEDPDREGRVTRTLAEARNWLGGANADWNRGLDLAETAANLMESAQIVPLHELPTRQVAQLRRGQENLAELRTLVQNDITAMQPYAH